MVVFLTQMIGIMGFAAVLAVALAGAQPGSGGSGSGPGASLSPRGPHPMQESEMILR